MWLCVHHSLETPSFSGATSRAWCSLRNGLSATLEPLLSTGSTGSSSVTSTSRRRESSPEREKVGQYKCPTRRPRRPRRRSGSWSDRSYTTDDDDELLEDDPTFTPNAPTRLTLKIPTVTRRCSRPCLLTQTSKPILRTSTSPTSLPLPLSPNSAPQSTSPLPSPSLSSTSPRRPQLPPPTRVTTSPPLPTSHPHAATLIPVVDCCRTCRRAAEYGNLEEKFYVEQWSKGAKRLKEEQEKERKEREEWAKDAQSIRNQYVSSGSGEKRDGEEEEEDLSASQLGRKAKGVDELQLGRDKRHVKTIMEKEDAGELLQSQEKEIKEGIEIPLPVAEPQELLLSGSIESTSPLSSPLSDHTETSPTTPLTSPDTAPTRRFNDEKLPPPPVPSEPEPKRPPMGKQRSSSISRKVASFGSSFFGSSNGGISGAKFA